MTVLDEVAAERARQDAKWGVQDHPSFNRDELDPEAKEMAVTVSNICRVACEEAFKRGQGSYSFILREEVAESFAERDDEAKLREELIQVAAVAVAWVEAIDRRTIKTKAVVVDDTGTIIGAQG